MLQLLRLQPGAESIFWRFLRRAAPDGRGKKVHAAWAGAWGAGLVRRLKIALNLSTHQPWNPLVCLF